MIRGGEIRAALAPPVGQRGQFGQTEAALDLCVNVPIDEKYHYVQPGVGHYGVFNGRRWKTEIQPRIREFIRTIQFKRRTGDTGMTYGLPYRSLQEKREPEVDWEAVEG